MTNALCDCILGEIRSVHGMRGNAEDAAGNSDKADAAWPGRALGREGYLQWTWGGRIHMVPKGWCLPMGTVSMLFHLWVNGNASMQLAPYQFLKGWDLQATEERSNLPLVLPPEARAKALTTRTQTWLTYLSQAGDVMLAIAQHANTTFAAFAAMQASERESKFIQAFTAMCQSLHPDLSEESLDTRRMHE